MIEFKKAQLTNLSDINALIEGSRSVWNYPEEYAKASLHLITMDEKTLNSEICYEIRNPELVGFLSFEKREDEVFLENLWIKKSTLKQGIGAATSKFIDQLANENGWSKIQVFPDPPAEGFYLKCGYINTGNKFPSRIQGRPTFTLFEKAY
ncbi:GNAT family N-acetyltransferase [Bdellovibrio sp. GT3]|uniref:GNAT family N-acetyltransferase n=1 Tax=Bdellovibrio sp. GT3 TaxID=3136282 RepID=UPI0030F45B60